MELLVGYAKKRQPETIQGLTDFDFHSYHYLFLVFRTNRISPEVSEHQIGITDVFMISNIRCYKVANVQNKMFLQFSFNKCSIFAG